MREDESSGVWEIANAYAFAAIEDPEGVAEALRAAMAEAGARGTILVAREGINVSVAAPLGALDALLEGAARAVGALRSARVHRARHGSCPFVRSEVRVRDEIARMRRAGVDAAARSAPRVGPEELRDWMRGDDPPLLIDCRNDFEARLGSFRGAENPSTRAFHQFPEVAERERDRWQGRDVVMFCTGGIRCEKASSWMLERGGFSGRVHQLEGGILAYFERIEDAERDWEGELFVFDDRIALDTALRPTGRTLEALQEEFASQAPGAGSGPREAIERALSVGPETAERALLLTHEVDAARAERRFGYAKDNAWEVSIEERFSDPDYLSELARAAAHLEEPDATLLRALSRAARQHFDTSSGRG